MAFSFFGNRKEKPKDLSIQFLADEVGRVFRLLKSTNPNVRVRTAIHAVLDNYRLTHNHGFVEEIHREVCSRGGRVAGERSRERARQRKLRKETENPQMQLALGDRPLLQGQLSL